VASPWQLADRRSIQNNHKPKLHIIYECGFCCAASESWVVFPAFPHPTFPPFSHYFLLLFCLPFFWSASKNRKGGKAKAEIVEQNLNLNEIVFGDSLCMPGLFHCSGWC